MFHQNFSVITVAITFLEAHLRYRIHHCTSFFNSPPHHVTFYFTKYKICSIKQSKYSLRLNKLPDLVIYSFILSK